MKSRHSVFVVMFVAASVTACAVLPYSVIQYIDVCKKGFGAGLEIENASLHTTNGVHILVLTFRYTSPDRLSTKPGEYWFNLSANGVALSLTGSVDKTFMRGVSDIDTSSVPVTAEQFAALANDEGIVVDYWIWVNVPDRGSGSALAGSQSVPLEAS
ncbi:MAG: hypothetical protein V1934_02415 [Methanobacteriota archaeon]